MSFVIQTSTTNKRFSVNHSKQLYDFVFTSRVGCAPHRYRYSRSFKKTQRPGNRINNNRVVRRIH